MKMKKNNLQPALQQFFEEYLTSTKGVSSNTIRSYRYTFRLLLQFLFEQHGVLPARADFCDLEGDTVPEFLKWLEQARNCGAATRNQRLAAMRSFSKFAAHYCFQSSLAFGTSVSAIPRKKAAKKAMAYMTKEEMSIVLSLPRGNTLAEKRDRVLLSVLYASGARAQELCDLRIQDVRFEKEKAHLHLNGKEKKARIAVIPADCTALLAQYMKRNHFLDSADPGRYLFSSQTHEHMTISCVEGIVKKYIKQARTLHPGLFRESSYTPHSFRHSVAVHMLEAGIPLPVIKNFLGHSSLETTMVYATISQELRDKYLVDYNASRALSQANEDDDGLNYPDYLK